MYGKDSQGAKCNAPDATTAHRIWQRTYARGERSLSDMESSVPDVTRCSSTGDIDEPSTQMSGDHEGKNK